MNVNTLAAILIALVPVAFSACAPNETGQTRAAGAREPLANASPDLERKLDELVPTLQTAYLVPGVAIGVIRGGEVAFERYYGVADIAEGRSVDDGAAFNIGSISKTVAAWGILRLVEQGKIDLDAPVDKYLTRWQLPPQSAYEHTGVTARRLLSHTAGLSVHGYPGFGAEASLPTVEESLAGATNGSGAVQVIHEPGSKWQYSGGGYTVAQLMIEETSGRSFAEYMDIEVLDPLGMTSSSYLWDNEIDRIAATPYDAAGEPISGPRFTAMAAAGLQTTLPDLLRFAVASMGSPHSTNEVLEPETIALMHRPVAPASDWGLGYEVMDQDGQLIVGHGGSNDGWRARFEVSPHTGDGIVVMTNGSNGGVIRESTVCEWRASLAGTRCLDPPEFPVEVEESVLLRAQGRYEVAGGPTLLFRVDAGRLLVDFENDPRAPAGFRALALPRSETEFFLPMAQASVELELDDTGKPTGLSYRQGDQPPRYAVRLLLE